MVQATQSHVIHFLSSSTCSMKTAAILPLYHPVRKHGAGSVIAASDAVCAHQDGQKAARRLDAAAAAGSASETRPGAARDRRARRCRLVQVSSLVHCPALDTPFRLLRSRGLPPGLRRRLLAGSSPWQTYLALECVCSAGPSDVQYEVCTRQDHCWSARCPALLCRPAQALVRPVSNI